MITMNKIFWSGIVSVLLAIWVVFPIAHSLADSNPFIGSFFTTGIFLATGGFAAIIIGLVQGVNK